jgi:hypothetical protein
MEDLTLPPLLRRVLTLAARPDPVAHNRLLMPFFSHILHQLS